jgi:uncharacterized protein DUF1559
VYGSFPPAVTTDGKGRPMHSWTVYLLPFLGHKRLYAAYNFAEPFDSAGNRKVGSAHVTDFVCPAAWRQSRAVTHYGMVFGPGSVGGVDQYTRLADVTDDPDQTLLVMEMGRTPVPWTSPTALVGWTDPKDARIASPHNPSADHRAGCFTGTVSGKAGFFGAGGEGSLFVDLYTISGGEKVEWWDW